MSETIRAPEQRTIDVDVGSLDSRGRTVAGYAALYDVLSDDLGGYRGKIRPGAFANVLDAPEPSRVENAALRPYRDRSW